MPQNPEQPPPSDEVAKHAVFEGLDACVMWLRLQGMVEEVEGRRPKLKDETHWLAVTLMVLLADHEPEMFLSLAEKAGVTAKLRIAERE